MHNSNRLTLCLPPLSAFRRAPLASLLVVCNYLAIGGSRGLRQAIGIRWSVCVWHFTFAFVCRKSAQANANPHTLPALSCLSPSRLVSLPPSSVAIRLLFGQFVECSLARSLFLFDWHPADSAESAFVGTLVIEYRNTKLILLDNQIVKCQFSSLCI